MASPRPIKADYYNGKATLFKVGRSSTVQRAVQAAVRTVTELNLKKVDVQVYNQRGLFRAAVTVRRGRIEIYIKGARA